ncbi:CVNH domain-containing protein [Funiculus sociatus]|nr:hypothetical protein [Trichocoleus sp. FACHB-69]
MLKYATFASVLLLTFLPSNIVLARGEFTKTCSNITLEEGHFLEANCETNNGGRAQTGRSINNLIANRNGKLVWSRNGNYIATSQNCDVDFQSNRTFLECDTRKSDGSWTSSTLELDRHIANINGNLRVE